MTPPAAMAQSSETVYDSLPGATFGGDSVGVGNEIALAMDLAGARRRVNHIDLTLGTNAELQFRVRFYQLDGGGGSPGSMIWESDVQTYPFEPGSFNRKLVPVDVPSILVPDQFALAVAPTLLVPQSGSTILMGESVGQPAAGTFLNKWMKTSSWMLHDTTIHGYGARITAVPEPHSLALASLAIGTLPLLRRIRKRRGDGAATVAAL
jgi:hypothetical protein